MTDAAHYAELHCHSYFSLLDGASAPEELVARAVALGLRGLALTDHDSLAGAVRFAASARQAGLHALSGAEVTLVDGAHLTLLAETAAGYGNLCKLITLSRLDHHAQEHGAEETAAWAGKVEPVLGWEQLAAHSAGLIALSGCRRGPVATCLLRDDADAARQALGRLQAIFGRGQLFLELQHHDLPDDDRLLRRLLALNRGQRLPLVVTHNVHYATPDRSMLRDVLHAVRHNQSLTAARQAGHLPFNSNYALPAPAAMARRFAQQPAALANTLAIAERCQVVLDFSGQRLPVFNPADFDQLPAGCTQPPVSAFALLYDLCHVNLPRRYPDLRPLVLKQLAHELEVIEQAGLAGYFLVVWDIVRFARAQGIRCQGRGSAANSIVAYLLGITAVDPLAHDLLFARFLSSDKFTMPDIDIDFAADRREEVIQYVYRRYGQNHTAMVCNVVTYQARSALRDLGKALELPDALIDALAGRLEANAPADAARQLADHPAPAAVHLATLLRQIDGCPRHLSIHSGGMLITGAPLDEIVPLEPATMPGRVVCQWDKESVEDAGLIKIDLLALRTLGVISEALAQLTAAGARLPDLERLPLDDPAVYGLLQRGDTIGAFQVESRAQQQMLPRLRPACFADIVVEVAIVRPGPIQGGAVHPYLRRRTGQEAVSYLHPSLEPVLAETLGVLLFQEQAIRLAVTVAGFAPGEADLLRRALSRNRSDAALGALRNRFVQGAAAQGVDAETAATIFAQLAGFAGYGFCKSHAASFALIAYQTLWLKRYHAAAFYCALLNQQPMGFYPPEVLIGDARRHNVETLPPDINRSDWNYTLERDAHWRWALRTGLHVVAGLGVLGMAQLATARQTGGAPFAGLEDFCRRTRLAPATITSLIRAGALDAFGARRDLLWRLGEIDYRPDAFELASLAQVVELPPLAALEQTAWEYELMGLAPSGQLMRHYRAALRRHRVCSTGEVKQKAAGARVQTSGYVVVRQRPATAKGILFMSLEDESGLLDLVVKPARYAALQDVLRGEALLFVTGVVQRSGRAVSLLVEEASPFSLHPAAAG